MKILEYQKLPISLNIDAIFIADAHDNSNRKIVYSALKEVERLQPSQLFLVGDIFDLLVGEVEYTKKLYRQEISLINKLAKTIEVFYFEGNHDFSLEGLFENVTLYSRKQQPVVFQKDDQLVSIAHGDVFENFGYDLYTAIIRNSTLLKILNFIDIHINYTISKKIIEKLSYKQQCRKYSGFEENIERRISLYPPYDIIIEAHFHQDKRYKNYINLPSLACNTHLFKLFKQKES
jgi:UDP-2,3-diacylglucosamine hydrolase